MPEPFPPYDSRADTLEHIVKVRWILMQMSERLHTRAIHHDASKLEPPEKQIFDKFTPKLRATTYGSDEYKKYLDAMGEGLAHHYKVNSHHPEHYENGIFGMDLLDVVEMLCDWMAAVQRHEDGDIHKSIELNQERFGYSDDLKAIFHNTVTSLERG